MCDDGDMCPWWIPLFTEGSSLLRKSVQPWWVGFVCSVCKGISPLWYLIISLRFRCILKDTRTVQSPFSQHFRTFLRTSELVALSHFHPPAASDGAKMRTVGQVSERLAWFSMDQATVGFAMRGLGLLLFYNRYLSLQTIFHPTADFSIGNSRFSESVTTFSYLKTFVRTLELVFSAIPSYFWEPQNDNANCLPSLGLPWSSWEAWSVYQGLQQWKCSPLWSAVILYHETMVSHVNISCHSQCGILRCWSSLTWKLSTCVSIAPFVCGMYQLFFSCI